MPLYEFFCRKCNKKIEVLVMSGEKPCCSRCGGRDLERLFSTFASPGLSGGSESSGSCSSCPPGRSCSHCH